MARARSIYSLVVIRLSHDWDAVGSGRRGDKVDDMSTHDDDDVGDTAPATATEVSVLRTLRSLKYREISRR